MNFVNLGMLANFWVGNNNHNNHNNHNKNGSQRAAAATSSNVQMSSSLSQSADPQDPSFHGDKSKPNSVVFPPSASGHPGEPGAGGTSVGGSSVSGPMSREMWMKDSHSPHCYGCESLFTILNRRHHCRSCGLVFCGKCTQKTIPTHLLSKEPPPNPPDESKRERVCDHCYNVYYDPPANHLDSRSASASKLVSASSLPNRSFSASFSADWKDTKESKLPRAPTLNSLPYQSSGILEEKTESVDINSNPYYSGRFSQDGLEDSGGSEYDEEETEDDRKSEIDEVRNRDEKRFSRNGNEEERNRTFSSRSISREDHSTSAERRRMTKQRSRHNPRNRERHSPSILPSSFSDDSGLDYDGKKQRSKSTDQLLSVNYNFSHNENKLWSSSERSDKRKSWSVDFSQEHSREEDGSKKAENESKEQTSNSSRHERKDSFNEIKTNKRTFYESDNGEETDDPRIGLQYYLQQKSRHEKSEGEGEEEEEFTELDLENGKFWELPPPENDEEDENFFTDSKTMNDEDEEEGHGMWSNPSVFQSKGLKETLTSAEAIKTMKDVIEDQFRNHVEQMLRGGGVNTNQSDSEDTNCDWVHVITKLALEAASLVEPDTSEGYSMDPGKYAKVKCIASGRPSDSCVINGIVCKKNIANKRMANCIEKPNLLLLGGALEYQRVSNQLSFMDTLIKQQKNHLDRALEQINRKFPKNFDKNQKIIPSSVLLVEKTVSGYAQESLLTMKISLVLNVKRSLLDRISRCTGAQVSSSESPASLGHCQKFYTQKFTEDLGPPGKRNVKTLMFFEGCPYPLGCTVLLRGSSSDELKKIKRVIPSAISLAYHLALEASFLADEGAILYPCSVPKQIISSPLHPSLQNDEDSAQKPIYKTSIEETNPEPPKLAANPSQLSAFFSQSKSANSPSLLNLPINSKYLSESLPHPTLEANTKGTLLVEENTPRLHNPTSSHPVDIPRIRSEFTRNHYGSYQHQGEDPMERNLSQFAKTNEVPASPSEHHSILVSVSSRCLPKSVVCESPRLRRIRYYGDSDTPLGGFLRFLFDRNYVCKTCELGNEHHVRVYTHKEGSLTISVKNLKTPLPGDKDKIWLWHRCRKCDSINGVYPATKRVLMSDAACKLSLGKFLELSFSNHSSANRVARCGHLLHRDCLRFFGCGDKAACFTYAPMKLHTVLLPSLQLEFHSNKEQKWLEEEYEKLVNAAGFAYDEVANRISEIAEKYVNSTSSISCSPNTDAKRSLAVVDGIFNNEKNTYQNKINAASPVILQHNEETLTDILTLNFLRRELTVLMEEWDKRLNIITKELQNLPKSVASADLVYTSSSDMIPPSSSTTSTKDIAPSECSEPSISESFTKSNMDGLRLEKSSDRPDGTNTNQNQHVEPRIFIGDGTDKGDYMGDESEHYNYEIHHPYVNSSSSNSEIKETSPQSIYTLKSHSSKDLSSALNLMESLHDQKDELSDKHHRSFSSNGVFYTLKEVEKNDAEEETVDGKVISCSPPSLIPRTLSLGHIPVWADMKSFIDTEWHSDSEKDRREPAVVEVSTSEKASLLPTLSDGLNSDLFTRVPNSSVDSFSVNLMNDTVENNASLEISHSQSHKIESDGKASVNQVAASISKSQAESMKDDFNKGKKENPKEKNSSSFESFKDMRKEQRKSFHSPLNSIENYATMSESGQSFDESASASDKHWSSNFIQFQHIPFIQNWEKDGLKEGEEGKRALDLKDERKREEEAWFEEKKNGEDTTDEFSKHGWGKIVQHSRSHSMFSSTEASNPSTQPNSPTKTEGYDSSDKQKNSVFTSNKPNLPVRKLPPLSHQSFGRNLKQVVSSNSHILLPLGVDDRAIAVYDDEPTSIIAYAISSVDYHRALKGESSVKHQKEKGKEEESERDDETDKKKEIERSKKPEESFTGNADVYNEIMNDKRGDDRFGGHGRLNKMQFDSDKERDVGDEEKEKERERDEEEEDSILSTEQTHIKIKFPRGEEGKKKNSQFQVTAYFAKQFEALRKKCCGGVLGDLQFVRSISRCKSWSAQGGKSTVYFAKTMDDRFVIKQVQRKELLFFLDFAKHYFRYLLEAYNSANPTCLAKILGLYQVGVKGNTMDVMVMENLFYSKNISRIYDLKGSIRSRYNNDVKGKNRVLLDENLLETMPTTPIFVGKKAKQLLERAIWNDTAFLADMYVMDYSLLVGVEEEKHELVLGIIDFIRPYTWDKQLETWVKGSGILGGPKNTPPTVISPAHYKNRFRKAMKTYFVLVPDQFTPHTRTSSFNSPFPANVEDLGKGKEEVRKVEDNTTHRTPEEGLGKANEEKKNEKN